LDDHEISPWLSNHAKWEGWAIAIRGAGVDGIDSPKAIIRGSYREIRVFELVYHRIKVAAKRSPSTSILNSRITMEA
jgi:hypothetical protein